MRFNLTEVKVDVADEIPSLRIFPGVRDERSQSLAARVLRADVEGIAISCEGF